MMIGHIIFFFTFIGLGIFPLYASISSWKKRLSCKDKINGTFIKIVHERLHSNSHLRAEWEYYYNGKKYHEYAVDPLYELSRKYEKKFIPGETYPLYINPEHPKFCRCTKRIVTLGDLLLFLEGSLVCVVVILGSIGQLISYFS